MNNMEELIKSASDISIKIVIALAVLFVSFKLTNRLCRVLEDKILSKGKLDKTIATTIGYVLRIALKVLVGISLVNYLGINTASMATIIASLGVGVGLAVNGTVANFAGGLLVLVTRPYRVDDFIDVAGVSGTVEAIRLVHTKLRTIDNKVIYIPNGTASGATVINYSEKETRRLDQTYNIAYEADFERAKDIISGIAAADGRVFDDPQPFVRMSGHRDSAVEISCRFWCRSSDYWDLHFDMLEAVKKGFDAAGISIPYPQVDVHMR